MKLKKYSVCPSFHFITILTHSQPLILPIVPCTFFVSEKLGLDAGFRLETNSVVPPTPAPRSVRPPPSRRRARRSPSSSDDSDIDGQEDNLHATSVSRVAATPVVMTAARSQRASKTAAMSKMSAKPTVAASSDDESDDQSGVTSGDDSSDEDSS